MTDDIAFYTEELIRNAIASGANAIGIELIENTVQVELGVWDNGEGMSPEESAQAAHPFYTTRTTRDTGLGLALLRQSTEATGGSLTIQSEPGTGTIVTARWITGHLDRPPLGDIGGVLELILSTHPDINFDVRQSVEP